MRPAEAQIRGCTATAQTAPSNLLKIHFILLHTLVYIYEAHGKQLASLIVNFKMWFFDYLLVSALASISIMPVFTNMIDQCIINNNDNLFFLQCTYYFHNNI